MSEKKLYFARLSLLFADMAFFAIAMRVFFRRHENMAAPPFVLWGTVAAAGLLVNTLLFRKGKSVNASVFFTAVLGIFMGGALIVRISAGEYSFWMTIAGVIMGAGPVIHGAVLIHEKWDFRRQSLFLDGLVAAAAFLLLADYTDTFTGIRPYLIWTFFALAMSALMLMACRMPDAGPASFFRFGLFAALCFCAWIAGSSFQKAAVRIAGIAGYVSALLMRLIRTAGNWLAALLNRLISLIPLRQEEIVLQEAPQQNLDLPELFPDVQPPGMTVPAVLLCILAVLVCFLIWQRLRGRRWQPPSAFTSSDPGVRKEKKNGRLQSKLADLAARMAFFFRYLLNRNTPEGLLTYAENKMAGTENRRRKGETAPGFLRRISGMLDEDGARTAGNLAEVLENAYYNNRKAELPKGFERRYRKSLKGVKRDGSL